jgi:hypothetical protein
MQGLHFYTDVGPAAVHPVSHLEAPLQSTHSLLSDQILMHESLQYNSGVCGYSGIFSVQFWKCVELRQLDKDGVPLTQD